MSYWDCENLKILEELTKKLDICLILKEIHEYFSGEQNTIRVKYKPDLCQLWPPASQNYVLGQSPENTFLEIFRQCKTLVPRIRAEQLAKKQVETRSWITMVGGALGRTNICTPSRSSITEQWRILGSV